MQLVDQGHVGENVGVAHMEQRRFILEVKHQPVGIAERMRNPVFGDLGGGVKRVGEGGGKTVERNGAAGISHVQPVHALRSQPCGEIGVGQHHGTGFLCQRDRIAHMVAVPVGQENVGNAGGGVLGVEPAEAGIAGKERIDQDFCLRGLDTEGRMAEPGDFHVFSPDWMLRAI